MLRPRDKKSSLSYLAGQLFYFGKPRLGAESSPTYGRARCGVDVVTEHLKDLEKNEPLNPSSDDGIKAFIRAAAPSWLSR